MQRRRHCCGINSIFLCFFVDGFAKLVMHVLLKADFSREFCATTPLGIELKETIVEGQNAK